MLVYPIILTPDGNDTLLVTCPLLPMVATFGTDEADAFRHGLEAIEVALASMIEDGEDVPVPPRGAKGPPLPLLTALKLELYWALRAAGLTRAELARRLQWNRESVDRLFRLDHRSRLEQMEAAFRALGRQVDVTVKDAA